MVECYEGSLRTLALVDRERGEEDVLRKCDGGGCGAVYKVDGKFSGHNCIWKRDSSNCMNTSATILLNLVHQRY